MSIEKVGSMDTTLNSVASKQVHHKQAKVPANDAAVTHEAPRNDRATRVIYSPFLPVGDTQSIHKELRNNGSQD